MAPKTIGTKTTARAITTNGTSRKMVPVAAAMMTPTATMPTKKSDPVTSSALLGGRRAALAPGGRLLGLRAALALGVAPLARPGGLAALAGGVRVVGDPG